MIIRFCLVHGPLRPKDSLTLVRPGYLGLELFWLRFQLVVDRLQAQRNDLKGREIEMHIFFEKLVKPLRGSCTEYKK